MRLDPSARQQSLGERPNDEAPLSERAAADGRSGGDPQTQEPSFASSDVAQRQAGERSYAVPDGAQRQAGKQSFALPGAARREAGDPRLEESAPAAEQRCVVCDGDAGYDTPLCSRRCLMRARRELDANVARIRQGCSDPDARAALAARNGHLTSALIRWRP